MKLNPGAREWFQNVLYGKFLEKALLKGTPKATLKDKWKNWSDVIANLPNGHYHFRCKLYEMMQKLMLDRPWAMNGLVLQLVRWNGNFQSALVKLVMVVI